MFSFKFSLLLCVTLHYTRMSVSAASCNLFTPCDRKDSWCDVKSSITINGETTNKGTDTCVPFLAAGAKCEDQVWMSSGKYPIVDFPTCDVGLSCTDDDVCVALPKEGEACLEGEWCGVRSELVCGATASLDSYSCVKRASTAIGERCRINTQCAGGAFCDGDDPSERRGVESPTHSTNNTNACVALLADGATCARDSECINHCDGASKKCMAFKTWDDACTENADCVPGENWWKPYQGMSPSDHAECYNNKCVHTKPNEENGFGGFSTTTTCPTVNHFAEMFRCRKYNDEASCGTATDCAWTPPDAMYGTHISMCGWRPATTCKVVASDMYSTYTMTFAASGITVEWTTLFSRMSGAAGTLASTLTVGAAVVSAMSMVSLLL